MGHPAYEWPQRRRSGRPWPRRRDRRWTRADGFPTAGALLSAIPSLRRAVLARLTERMIDRMDEIDGDPDLEHFLEDDEDGHDHEGEETYA